MKAKLSLAAAVMIVVLASIAQSQASTVLFEDHFESPSDTLGNAPTGWTVSGNSGASAALVVNNAAIPDKLPYLKTETPGPHPGDTSNATQYLSLKGGNTGGVDAQIVQTNAINTLGYSAMTVSFDYAAYRSEQADTLKFLTTTDGGKTYALVASLALGPPDVGAGHDAGLPWTHFVTILTNIVGSLVIEFQLATSENEYGYLDNLVVTAVPVPGSLSLGAAGLGALGLLGWLGKRKRSDSLRLALD